MTYFELTYFDPPLIKNICWFYGNCVHIICIQLLACHLLFWDSEGRWYRVDGMIDSTQSMNQSILTFLCRSLPNSWSNMTCVENVCVLRGGRLFFETDKLLLFNSCPCRSFNFTAQPGELQIDWKSTWEDLKFTKSVFSFWVDFIRVQVVQLKVRIFVSDLAVSTSESTCS